MRLSVALPVLVMVIACTVLDAPILVVGNVVVPLTVTAGTAASAVTESGNTDGVALLAGVVGRYTVSLSGPTAFGVAVISKVHDVDGATEGDRRHWLVPSTLKPAPPPVKETLLITRVVVEVLVNVACNDDEVTPTAPIPKSRPIAGA